jgi:CRP/FNR family nitrogen fixation transcriptional regulator
MLDRIEISAMKQVSFGPFRLLPYQRLLLLQDKPVPLGSRALDILAALVERAGELLTKDELMSRIWPDTTVEAANVTVHIAALRRALGDGTEGRRYVVTVPGRGYIFVAPVSVDVPLPLRPDEPPGVTLRLAKGKELFGEGEPAVHFYKVAIGTVRTYKVLSDGRRQIDSFHLAGDIFGIEAGSEHRFSAEAVNAATVIAWRRSRLDRLTREHPAFGEQVMASMIGGLERAHDHMLLLGRKKAPEKIATFLLQLAERVEEDEELELPMQRSDIADHLGLTAETVSRTLTELSRQGLIKLDASGRSVFFVNKPALQVLNA